MDEFEDSAQPAEDGYADEGYADESYADHAQPPDLSDALSQLNERQQQLYDRDGGYEEEGPYVEDNGYDQDAALDPEQALGEIVDERVAATLEPILERQEMQQREGEIQALAEQYPGLRDPENLQIIGEELGLLADQYGDPSIRSDPRMIETLLFAVEGKRAALAAAQQPEQPQRGGAVLETGAGPGGAPTEVDPVERAYTEALLGDQGRDSYGFPTQ